MRSWFRRFLRSASRGIALLPVVLCPLLALSGCGNNPYPESEHRGDMIYLTLSDDPRTLDPSRCYLVTDGQVVSAIYESFFQYHYLKRDPFVLQLALGAEMPKREPYTYTATEKGKPKTIHGERWTFRIKKGLHFQDDPCFPGGKGREIVAADFIHSLKRMADPDVLCPVLSYFADKVIGLQEFADKQQERTKNKQGMDYNLPVAGLQPDPKDPYTFRIALNQPYPQLKYLMAMAFTTPLAHEATERYGKELARHCVGEGPYVMTEWLPKQRIVLKPNPNYRKDSFYPTDGSPGDREAGLLEDAGKPLPLNDGIVFSIIHERITGWNLFLQGYLDQYAIDQNNYSQAVSQVGTISPEMARKGIRLDKAIGADFNYFGFNMNDPVVGGYDEKHRKLRQALSLAYDAAAEINLFDVGLGTEAQWAVPPGLFSYDPSFRNPYRQTNLAKAKQLLAEAGYPNGIDPATNDRLEIVWDNSATEPQERQFAAFVQAQFEQLGIKFTSRPWRSEIWQDKVDKGEVQFFAYGWIADYPDAENFAFLLYGPNKRPGPNSTAYNNPEYNKLFEQARAMDDTPERKRILDRLRDIAVEDSPYIYRDHSVTLRLIFPWLHNVKAQPIALDVHKYRRVDSAMRAKLRDEWNQPFYWPLVGFAILLVLSALPAMQTVRNRARKTARSKAN